MKITAIVFLIGVMWAKGAEAQPPDNPPPKFRDVYYDPTFKPPPKSFLPELRQINQALEEIQRAQSNLLQRLIAIALATNRTDIERREAIFGIAALNTDEADRWLVDHQLLWITPMRREFIDEGAQYSFMICYDVLHRKKSWRTVQIIINSLDQELSEEEITKRRILLQGIMLEDGRDFAINHALGAQNLSERKKANLERILRR